LEKFIEAFSRKWRSKFLGRGTFSSSPTWGAPFPQVTLGNFGAMDPDKKNSCSGGIDPHLGFGGQGPQNGFFLFFILRKIRKMNFP